MAEIYRSDIVRVDLDHALLRKHVGAILVTGDKLGNRFGAEIFRDGKPVDVTGCGVTAYFMRPGEDAIVLTGTASGSVAYVDLAQACYSKASSFTLTIKISYGGSTTALRVIDGYILLTQTDELVDPGEVIPTLDDLLAQIEAMEAATAEALAAADSASLAKGAIEEIDSPVPAEFVTGTITNGGTVSAITTRIRSANPILITGGMRWYVDEKYRASVAIYNDAAFTNANFVGFVGGSTSAMYHGDITIPAKYIGKYMGIRIAKYGSEDSNITGDLATIGDYVKLHDVSKLLSVGNFRQYVKDDARQFLPIRGASSFRWNFGTSVSAEGEERNDNSRSAMTDMIPVKNRVDIINLLPATDHKDRVFNVFVAEYKDDVFVKRTQLTNEAVYTTAAETDGIRLMAAYPSSVSAEMTITNLKTNFAVGFVGNIIPGDGKRPKYVAFGASTTVGAVHWPDKAHTYTPYAFPDYIGQVLGLETYNLGNGSTGFMARNDGASPNFMDAIYNNGEKLKEADLITLTFGYGNDAALDPKLPFGSWDDYFPYDEVGAFYVEGNATVNMNGISRMLENGATLMGCLNWCIKWIGEHYPQATLVCIYGAPSGNKEYPISVSNDDDTNAGTYGHRSHKIVVDRKIGTELGGEEIGSYDKAVNTLRAKLNVPIVNLNTDSLPFSYYSTTAVADDGMFAVFSTVKNDAGELIFNSHPNERGYLMYARYLAGKISEYFRH